MFGCTIVGILFLFIIFQLTKTTQSENVQMVENKTKTMATLKQDETNKSKQSEALSANQIKEIKVDIKGAVQYPGVYPAKTTQRINEVIGLAKPLENADLEWVNLSQSLYDGQVIYIPYKGEVNQNKFERYQQNTTQSNSKHSNQQKININQADQSSLENIPGIGPKKAQEIMQYRETHQGFKSIDEIKEIKGIGEKTFEQLKDFIEV